MSRLEDDLLFHIRACGLPSPVREHRFHETRRWRFDFAWVDKKIALEVEGGIWTGGRHTRGKAFNADCEKYNEALLMGWKVLRVTETHVRTGEAIEWAERALKN